jgi:hypothetical protein
MLNLFAHALNPLGLAIALLAWFLERTSPRPRPVAGAPRASGVRHSDESSGGVTPRRSPRRERVRPSSADEDLTFAVNDDPKERRVERRIEAALRATNLP